MIKRKKTSKLEITKSFKNEEYQNVEFDELIVRKVDFREVIFNNCKFINSYLGLNSKYDSCKFINCIFQGKYSSLGSASGDLTVYNNCMFTDCKLTGISLLEGVLFYSCIFSGILKNVILNDVTGKIKNFGTLFKNCDLKFLIFDNVNIYGKKIFDNSILPANGILKLDNRKDKLIIKANNCINGQKEDVITDIKVLFNANNHSGQDVIIFDEIFLSSFFSCTESKEVFNKIIEGEVLPD